MTIGNEYKVTKKIKIHTKPLVEVQITLQGIFKCESKAYYIFDSFRARKENIISIERV